MRARMNKHWFNLLERFFLAINHQKTYQFTESCKRTKSHAQTRIQHAVIESCTTDSSQLDITPTCCIV